MEEEIHRPERARNVRGNCFSFNMPWDQIVEQLERVETHACREVLPHRPELLKPLVSFRLRVGEVKDLKTFLPQARLRPHVVLKLCLALLDAGYPFQGDPADLRRRFKQQVAERYPETELDIPEDDRQGSIPPLVL